ncbi:MAG: restriction system protein [Thermoleophilaceae bacterium]|jgi:restriction system protein|nr:restriction system protein [Thermoleophilaceae bacterium]
MARRRGFFAELQYQNQLAARQRAQAERAQARAFAAATREAEQAQRRAERAAAAAARASAAEQKAAEREAKRLHVESRLAEVEALNSQLAATADELDSILSATLIVDDFVDLENLRVSASHPPFPRPDLEAPTPEVVPVSAPPEPVFAEPEAPTGLSARFGGKKRHEAAVAQAREAFEVEHRKWEAEAAAVPGRQLEQISQRDALERQRARDLQAARDVYQRECKARESEVVAANGKLDALIAGLAAGDHEAVQAYVGIVLGNSVYPEILDVEYDYEFDAETRELTLTVLVCPPDRLPTEKAYRYIKAKDEVAVADLSKKELRERYASVVDQVAVRTLHEVFEADRAGRIQTIALQVATETKDPATGLERRVAFVGVGAERDSFMRFDLRNVVPAATLQHLGATTSKNPYQLVGIDEAPGVRGR